ncbi:PEP-CTERM sorting domain-containing protein [bacterium]|nr:PEP-CTERM sorting domain-containing protein [bacterium]
MKKIALIGVMSFAAVAAHAAILTQWDFNGASATTVPGGTASPTASIGAGTATLLGGVTSTFASGISNGGSSDPVTTSPNNYGWNITTYAAQSTDNGNRGVRFDVSTIGFQGISFRFDVRKSNTSSRYQEVLYTLDGTNFISAGIVDGNAGDTWFNGNSFDLSTVAGANNNANFGFKVVAIFDPTNPTAGVYASSNPSSNYATTGTTRFDMVTVNAEAVPEPATMVVLGLVAAAAARRKRK